MGAIADFYAAKQQAAAAPVLGAAPIVPAQPQQHHGLFGFFGNLGSDAAGMVRGVGSLIGMGLHDVGETVGLAHGGYMLPKAFAAMPGAIAHDYASRYGSVHGFEQGLYQHPLSFLSDLLTVASLGGTAAATAAGAAAKAGEVGDIVSKIRPIAEAATAAQKAGDVGKAAELAAQVSEAQKAVPAWIRNVLPGVGTEFPGGTKYTTEAGQLVPKALPVNPYKRLFGTATEKVLTEPIASAQQRIASGALDLGQATRAQQVLDQAKALGLSRIDKPVVEDWRLRRYVDRIVGGQMSHFLSQREQATKDITAIHKGLTAEELSQAAEHYQGLDTAAVQVPQAVSGTAGRVRAAVDTLTQARPDLQTWVDRAIAAPPEPGSIGEATARLAQPVRDLIAQGGDVATQAKREAYLRQLHEPAAQQLAETAGQAFTPLDKAREGSRLWVEQHLSAPLIAKGWDPAILFDRQYLPLRIASGAKWDQKAAEWVGGKDSLALHAERQAAGLPTPIYFPHLDLRRLKFSDFLMSRRTVGAAKAVAPGFEKRTTGYLFQKGGYLTNPVEAYGRRAAQALRHQETMDLIQQVTSRFGRPIKNPLDVAPSERLYAPDGLLRFFSGKIALDDIIHSKLSQGTDLESSVATALKATGDTHLNALASDLGITRKELGQFSKPYLGVTKNGLPLYAIPKAVADRLEAQITPRLGEKTRLFFDQPTKVWRSAVLYGSPRFLLHHTLRNLVYLKLQGGKVSDVLRQLDPEFRAALDKVVPEEARTGFFSLGQQYTPRLGSAGQSTAGKIIQATSESKPMQVLHAYGDVYRRFLGEIENSFRRASYMDAASKASSELGLKNGFKSFWSSKQALENLSNVGANPQLMGRAVSRMNHFFHNYSTMSPFERNVMRRFLIPFWAPYRHAGKLFMSMPFTDPGRFDALRNLTGMANEMVAQQGAEPPWLQGATPIGPGSQPGDTRFLNVGSINPFSQIMQLPTMQLHPLLKSLLELSTGRSALTGNKFTQSNVVTPFGSSQSFKVGGGQAVPVDTVRPGILESLLRNFPQYQLAEQGIAGGKTYDTANLFSILAARLMPNAQQPQAIERLPQSTAAKYPISLLQKLLGFSGVPTTDYNLQKYQQNLSADQIAALRQFLKLYGQPAA